MNGSFIFENSYIQDEILTPNTEALDDLNSIWVLEDKYTGRDAIVWKFISSILQIFLKIKILMEHTSKMALQLL